MNNVKSGLSFEVQVSHDDIMAGVRGDLKRCALVHALKRLFPKAYSVHINITQSSIPCWYVTISTLKATINFDLPELVVQKLIAYENKGVMQPFNFSVEI